MLQKYVRRHRLDLFALLVAAAFITNILTRRYLGRPMDWAYSAMLSVGIASVFFLLLVYTKFKLAPKPKLLKKKY